MTDRLHSLRDSLPGHVLRGSAGVGYYLRECVGEGRQGWVFRANWDDPSGHVVIVKVLRPDALASEALRRFQREADVLRMLSTQPRPNPYIVRFFDHAIAHVPLQPDTHGLPFTVLEYVHGTTLERVLGAGRARGLPVERVRRLLRQMCQALEAVHTHKIVHRDFKPSNILLATEADTETAKVTDFGLAKVVDVSLVRTAALAGASLGYAPPEQYEQGNPRVSPRTDVFSVAAVAFEMLTGRPAFPFLEGENPLLIVTRILAGTRPSLGDYAGAVAPELEARPAALRSLDHALRTALAPDPAARYESVTAFWNAVEPALRAAGGAAPPPRQEPAMRARVSEHPPSTWTFGRLTPALGNVTLTAAAFDRSGEAAVALGGGRLFRWHLGSWIELTAPGNVPGSSLVGVRLAPSGDMLLFGGGGFAARVAASGAARVFRVPDREITFHGALVEDDDRTTLVGERPYRGAVARTSPAMTAGVVAQFAGDQVTLVSDAIRTTRLRAVARTQPNVLVACGDRGAIVRVELGVVEHIGSICAGHLVAIVGCPGGSALTVGAGGHALSLTKSLEPSLEAVQTTRDLLALATPSDGAPWAGSAEARLLRRTARTSERGTAHEWVRVSGDLGTNANVLAVSATATRVRAVFSDGGVVEGDAA